MGDGAAGTFCRLARNGRVIADVDLEGIRSPDSEGVFFEDKLAMVWVEGYQFVVDGRLELEFDC